jgi:hypothetical protein
MKSADERLGAAGPRVVTERLAEGDPDRKDDHEGAEEQQTPAGHGR